MTGAGSNQHSKKTQRLYYAKHVCGANGILEQRVSALWEAPVGTILTQKIEHYEINGFNLLG